MAGTERRFRIPITAGRHGLRSVSSAPVHANLNCEQVQGVSAAERGDPYAIVAGTAHGGGAYANHANVLPLNLREPVDAESQWPGTTLWLACAWAGYSAVATGPRVIVHGRFPALAQADLLSAANGTYFPTDQETYSRMVTEDARVEVVLDVATASTKALGGKPFSIGLWYPFRIDGADQALVVVTEAIAKTGTGASFILARIGT